MMTRLKLIIATLLLAVVANSALAGRIVVNHDEWTLSDTGFASSPGAGVFTDNVAQFFSGGGPGNFHAYSNNFGLTQSSLANAFSVAGHSYSTGNGFAFDLANLSAFDGIFLAGSTAGVDTSVLVDYVNAGGSVYLGAGTGTFGSAAAEADFWNPFLNNFGIGFQTSFNLSQGDLDVSSEPHPIFDGVGTLYENNGNTILELVALDPDTSIFFGGRYAVHDSASVIPVPAAFWLFGTALIGFVGYSKRRKEA